MDINTRTLWIRGIGLALVAGVLGYVTSVHAPAIVRLISNTHRFHDYLNSFGVWSALVFIVFQALQVVISPIPGELTQVAGGFVYGTYVGTVYSLIGILIGSVIAFYIARWFGFPLMRLLVPERMLEKFKFLINTPKAEIGMFILFFIPGVPKDVLTYVAGLTPVNPVHFFIMATAARLPGILLSSFIGAHVEEKEYTQVFIASALAVAVFVFGVIFRENIVRRIKRHHPPASN